MTRSKLYSLIRHTISLVGGILIAKGVVDSAIGLQITGAALAVTAVVFSIRDKTYTVNQIEGTLRQVLTALSGFLAFQSFLTSDMIELIVSAVSGILISTLGVSDKLKPEVPAATSDTP